MTSPMHTLCTGMAPQRMHVSNPCQHPLSPLCPQRVLTRVTDMHQSSTRECTMLRLASASHVCTYVRTNKLQTSSSSPIRHGIERWRCEKKKRPVHVASCDRFPPRLSIPTGGDIACGEPKEQCVRTHVLTDRVPLGLGMHVSCLARPWGLRRIRSSKFPCHRSDIAEC